MAVGCQPVERLILHSVTPPRSPFRSVTMSALSPPGSGTASPSGRAKRRANNDLLRNYYGLGQSQSGPPTPPSASSTGGQADRGIAGSESNADPTDADGARFDVDAAFRGLLQQKTLAQLLKEESDLLTDIRELDGERQSLVYNHHHELVSASETMRKVRGP